MSKYARLVIETVPQTEKLTPAQVRNNAGGFVFQVTDWDRLDRFLILGSSEPTYYQKAQALTGESAVCVERCFAADPLRTVQRITEISVEGRAPKNDPAIFALAIGSCAEDVRTRQLAFAQLSSVCRTATHLFQFVENRKALGHGWSRASRRAVAEWYDEKPVEAVAFQAIKYRARGNYTHKRLLETARPHKKEPSRTALYKWMKGKEFSAHDLPLIVRAHVEAMVSDLPKKVLLRNIKDFRLPWEAIPTEVTKDPEVWAAMLPTMGLTAMIRNLGAMTSYGTLKPLSEETQLVCGKLMDANLMRKARIHPFNLLLALTAYKAGSSIAARQYGKTGLSWSPIGTIVSALEDAFYASFKTVEPTGKRTLIGLDVSGSMSSPLMNSHLKVCEAAAAMAMTVMRTEPNWHIHAFADTFRQLPITDKMSLEEVLKHTQNVNFGGTDCSLPMTYALHNQIPVDVFQIYTDNETYAGRSHPVAALLDYRNKMKIPAKLIVVGMTSTGFSIADPQDPGMLDVVGFDSAAPAVMADFARR